MPMDIQDRIVRRLKDYTDGLDIYLYQYCLILDASIILTCQSGLCTTAQAMPKGV